MESTVEGKSVVNGDNEMLEGSELGVSLGGRPGGNTLESAGLLGLKLETQTGKAS